MITIFYLKRSLPWSKHMYMLAILGSLAMIGSSNVSADKVNKCMDGLM